MCSPACIAFVRGILMGEKIMGKRVLEVGSRNVNGSVRPFLKPLAAEYIGVDIEVDVDSVDLVCNAGELVEIFGEDDDGSFETDDAEPQNEPDDGDSTPPFDL